MIGENINTPRQKKILMFNYFLNNKNRNKNTAE